MTPSARLAAAIAVLDDWGAGSPIEVALTRWARGARYAGSGDRAAVRDHVFDVLRQRDSCAALGGGQDGRALVLGLLRATGQDPAALFTGAGQAPPPLDAAETARLAAAPPPGTAAPDLPDWPAWLVAPLDAAYGGDAPAIRRAMRARAPVWLRVATARTDRAAAAAALAADGVETGASPLCATALEVTGGARALRRAAAYLDGRVELQDLSAQRAVAAVDWPAGGRILDYCAGGGGKTLAIADRSGAMLCAHDARPARMADLGPRAARAGVAARLRVLDDPAAQAPYDAVLCDVPCSGSGTWRRDPEGKWRLTPERLAALTATQDAILDAARPLVRSGGLLVYMTCSLLPAENAARIAAFSARAPGWQRLGQGQDTPLTASDGFFHAILRAP